MIVIPGYQIKETIYKSDHSIVYRGNRLIEIATSPPPQKENTVVLKLLNKDNPSALENAAFRREYEMLQYLQGTGIIISYGMEDYQNSLMMVLEDFGGEPLARWIDRHHTGEWTLNSFFKIAIQITEILEFIHQKQVMHKDINPSNILWNAKTDQIKLIDFGIATLLEEERPFLFEPKELEGTLYYISPEQTGRMHRIIDYRTDFYSLGVTFFEMLTGRPPFEASTAMELVYCHLAHPCPSPQSLNPKVPLALAQIVMRLMEKSAEDRYQSASGLRFDLLKCQEQLEHQTLAPEFVLGEEDISRRFQIPQKIYGRQNEFNLLQKSFEKVCSGHKELILVTGPLGVGKTALVRELHKCVTQKQGFFVSGRFEQFRQKTPFSCFLQPFRALIKKILGETEEEIHLWKNKLLKLLGTNGQILIESIPELQQILGSQPPVPQLPPIASQNRFNYVFQSFLRTVAQPEHPLVVFLDDLQWADALSLDLLHFSVCDSAIRGLLLVAAYRSDSNDTINYLTKEKIDTLEHHAKEITLSPLPPLAVNQWVSDMLHCPLETSQAFAQLCFEKTQGNPFFLEQFFQSLHAEQLIYFNSENNQWAWRIDGIHQATITDNVVDWAMAKIQTLDDTTQTILKYAACLGKQFDLKTLNLVTNLEGFAPSEPVSLLDIWTWLQPAFALRLIVPSHQIGHSVATNLQELFTISLLEQGQFEFAHDRIQEAAYTLIEESTRADLHLAIGRLLLANPNLSEDNQAWEEDLLSILTHLNPSFHLLIRHNDPQELFQVTRVYMQAGQLAKKAQTYATATDYLKTCLQLLIEPSCFRSPNSTDVSAMSQESHIFSLEHPALAESTVWESHHDLIFSICTELVELLYLVNDFRIADKLYPLLLQKALSHEDRALVYSIQLEQLKAEGKFSEAIDICKEALALLGIGIPQSEREALTYFGQEYSKIPALFQKRSLAELAHENKRSSKKEEAQLVLLTSLSVSAYNLSLKNLLLWIAIKRITISLQVGFNYVTPYAFVSYALHVLAKYLKQYEKAYEFGKMAIDLSENYNNLSYLGRTDYLFAVYLDHWKHPISNGFPYLRKAIPHCIESGDLLYAGFSLTSFLSNQIISGQKLEIIQKTVDQYLPFIRQSNQTYFVELLWHSSLQILADLMGVSIEEVAHLDYQSFDEEAYLQQEKTPYALAFFYSMKLRTLYWFEHNEDILTYLDKLTYVARVMRGDTMVPEMFFYVSLVVTKVLSQTIKSHSHQQSTFPKDTSPYYQLLDSCQNKMRTWAKYSPTNYRHKYLLISAERAALDSNFMRAMKLYKDGIAAAKESNYVNNQALGNELYAKFWLKLEEWETAKMYMMRAITLYREWGAEAKAKHLEEKYPTLFMSATGSNKPLHFKPEPPPTSSFHEKSWTHASHQLDLDTIIKATQAISSETELGTLLKRLLETILENAGAQRGVLILKHNSPSEEQDNPEQLYIEGIITQKPFVSPDQHNTATHSEVLQAIPLEEAQKLVEGGVPKSLVRFVIRTGEYVVIDDALAMHQFSEDPFFQLDSVASSEIDLGSNESPQSILCVPLKKHERIDGALYLENHITTCVFTTNRIEILHILMTQAAISIEVASRTQELQKALDQLKEQHQTLKDTQSQLIQSEKLASIGTLMAGVAHEIKNPVNYVSVGAQNTKGHINELKKLIFFLAGDDVSDAIRQKFEEHFAPIYDSISTIMDGSNRIRTLINDLRTFSRLEETGKSQFDLIENLKSTIRLIQTEYKESIEFVCEFQDTPIVRGWPIQLGQVFMNIMVNACQAIMTTPKAQMATYFGRLLIHVHTEPPNVVIRFQDTGCGMSPDVQKKAFEPFYTTKSSESGTGLGLSISYGIIEKHQGRIMIDSQIGKGTTFTILLPI